MRDDDDPAERRNRGSKLELLARLRRELQATWRDARRGDDDAFVDGYDREG